MIISELIALLTEMQHNYGDLYVETLETECDCGRSLTDGGGVMPNNIVPVYDEENTVVAVAIDFLG
jgi:hypothetical protein